MQSGKQRRKQIKANRLKRVQASPSAESLEGKSYEEAKLSGLPVIKANHAELVHNQPIDALPHFYVDTAFICTDCRKEDVWTAKSQKWWYEVKKGSIYARAVRCQSCRMQRRDAKAAQKEHMQHMAALKSQQSL